jgi:hypothetical protein
VLDNANKTISGVVVLLTSAGNNNSDEQVWYRITRFTIMPYHKESQDYRRSNDRQVSSKGYGH